MKKYMANDDVLNGKPPFWATGPRWVLWKGVGVVKTKNQI